MVTMESNLSLWTKYIAPKNRIFMVGDKIAETCRLRQKYLRHTTFASIFDCINRHVRHTRYLRQKTCASFDICVNFCLRQLLNAPTDTCVIRHLRQFSIVSTDLCVTVWFLLATFECVNFLFFLFLFFYLFDFCLRQLLNASTDICANFWLYQLSIASTIENWLKLSKSFWPCEHLPIFNTSICHMLNSTCFISIRHVLSIHV